MASTGIKLSTEVKSAIGTTAENKTYELFQNGTSVVPLASADHASITALSKQVGASIGSASVVGGVLQISLSKAAEGRCSLRTVQSLK